MSYWTRLHKLDNAATIKSRQIAEFCRNVPDDPNKPGYKASPIPTYEGTVGQVDRSNYTMGHFNVGDLRTRQPFVETKRLTDFDESKLPEGDMKHPLVVMTRDNVPVVDNGNHRVARMIATGQKTTPARVIHEIHGYGGQGAGEP